MRDCIVILFVYDFYEKISPLDLVEFFVVDRDRDLICYLFYLLVNLFRIYFVAMEETWVHLHDFVFDLKGLRFLIKILILSLFQAGTVEIEGIGMMGL